MSMQNPAIGDEVRVNDPSVPRKHGKVGTLRRIPDPDETIEGENRWTVQFSDGTEPYRTRFKEELVWISKRGTSKDNTVDPELAEASLAARKTSGETILGLVIAAGVTLSLKEIAGAFQYKEIASMSGGRMDWAVVASATEIAAGGLEYVEEGSTAYESVKAVAADALTLALS